MLRSAARSGGWVCLKNLHLVVAWIPELEKELNNLTMHDDFRLWLTTEKHVSFSSMLLRSSLKITFEANPNSNPNLNSNTKHTLCHPKLTSGVSKTDILDVAKFICRISWQCSFNTYCSSH